MLKISKENNDRSKSKAALLSIISNTFLVLLKLLAGIATGSVAIISEALHSGLDLVASLITYVAIKISNKPADHEHPFGHGKAENLAALFEALLIVGAGLAIVWQSILSIINPEPLPGLGWGVLVMFISSTVNFFISNYLFKVGKKTCSSALLADGWHLRTDVYTSLGVCLGLGIITVGNFIWPDVALDIIDPICALAVAILILKTGFLLTWESIAHLIDRSLSEEDLQIIEDLINQFVPEIKGFSALQTRQAGPYRFITVNLDVDGTLSVEKAHELGHKVSEAVCAEFPETYFTFHLEPK